MSQPPKLSKYRPNPRNKGFFGTLTAMFNAVPSRFPRPPTVLRRSSTDFVTKITVKDIRSAKICGQGGFGVILRLSHRKGELALKRLMLTASEDRNDQGLHRALREADTWKALDRPNILPFLGVLETPDGIYIVSPFAKHGSLSGYVRNHPNVSMQPLLADAAAGVAFLHEAGIIHGDIKGSNILVSDDIRALLCDFGLARHVNDITSIGLQGRGTIRWESPELLERGAGKTTQSDMWAFGMTIYEVLSGKVPFYEHNSSSAVMKALIIENARPPKVPTHSPTGVSYDLLWKVAEACWTKDPAQRSSIKHAVGSLHPPDHPDHLSILFDLASELMQMFEEFGNTKYGEEATALLQARLRLCPIGHPERPDCLMYTGMALVLRFRRSADATLLEEAIILIREATQLYSVGSLDYFKAKEGLAVVLRVKSTTYGDAWDATASIELCHETLKSCPKGHPSRPTALSGLGFTLYTRFQLTGSEGDIEEAMNILREGVELCPANHPDREDIADSLGCVLHSNFKIHGNPKDLAGAIDLMREAVGLQSSPGEDGAEEVMHLGTVLVDSYRRGGEPKAIDLAVQLHREALRFCPGRHMHRYDILLALGNSLHARGGISDLDEAKQLYLEALELVPGDYPGNLRRQAMAQKQLGELEGEIME